MDNIEISYKYKEIVRKCLGIIRYELGTLGEYEDKILNMLATNKTLYAKHGNNIKLYDSEFESNFMYIFNNIKDFYKIVSTTFLNGEIGELVVNYIMSNTLNMIVKESTDEENIQGADLISFGKDKKWHQVKFIYDYEDDFLDDFNIIKIKNKYLDIKPTDKYDYLWFFVNDRSQVLLLKEDDIRIVKVDNGYFIRYTKIKKYAVSEDDVKKFREIAYSKIVLDFYDKIDSNSDAILNRFNSIN